MGNREMVFSSCAAWLKDWLEVDAPTLVDDFDLSTWMEQEMKDAIQTFLRFAFKTVKARVDALNILKTLIYEYYLFERRRHQALPPNPEAVARLPALPQSTQKSAAWHAESRNMLSGHEFGPVCIGTVSERNAVLKKKCAPEVVLSQDALQELQESQTVFMTSESGELSAFKWGWRYEPVARDLFERCVGQGTVFDGLGRVRHPTLPRLGASPDGLIMDGPRCGRLLEIKCPLSRVLNGTVPKHYYCQMQLQAEVCDVEAVEYVEVQFGAIPQNRVKDEPRVRSGVQPWIGKVCVVAAAEDMLPSQYQYAYSPLFPNTEEGLSDCLAWTPSGLIRESCVWYVKDWFHTTVLRNRRWWDSIGHPEYVRFWEDVDAARLDGRFKPEALFVEDGEDLEENGEGKEKEKEKEKVWQGVE